MRKRTATPHCWTCVAAIDPETAARLHVNDIGRQIRALEVHSFKWPDADRSYTPRTAPGSRKNSRWVFGLDFTDRALLYRRIEDRVDQMMGEGLLGEVRALLGARLLRRLEAHAVTRLPAHGSAPRGRHKP